MNTRCMVTTRVVGQMATNCFIVSDALVHSAVIIDPGDDSEFISDTLSTLRVTPRMIIITHGHFDHVMAAFALQMAYAIPCLMHEKDVFLLKRMQESAKHYLAVRHIDPPPQIDQFLYEGQEIQIDGISLFVYGTPGHTPGSVALFEKSYDMVFVGDTIFADGAVGRTDHTYSNHDALTQSIQKILSLPETTRIFAGHGQETTVALAKKCFSV